MGERSLSHTRRDCNYHPVFAVKFRRKEIYGKIKADKGKTLRELCEHKDVEIINAEAWPEHVHMPVSIPPEMSVSSFTGYLKGKSTLMIFERHGNLRYKHGNRHFWSKGYYASTAGRNKTAMAKYIENQLKEEMISDQMTLKEYVDPLPVTVRRLAGPFPAP